MGLSAAKETDAAVAAVLTALKSFLIEKRGFCITFVRLWPKFKSWNSSVQRIVVHHWAVTHAECCLSHPLETSNCCYLARIGSKKNLISLLWMWETVCPITSIPFPNFSYGLFTRKMHEINPMVLGNAQFYCVSLVIRGCLWISK